MGKSVDKNPPATKPDKTKEKDKDKKDDDPDQDQVNEAITGYCISLMQKIFNDAKTRRAEIKEDDPD